MFHLSSNRWIHMDFWLSYPERRCAEGIFVLMEVEECDQNCPASANLCQCAVCCATVASSNLAQAWRKKPLATHLHLQLEMQRVETEKRGTGTAARPMRPGNDVVCSVV